MSQGRAAAVLYVTGGAGASSCPCVVGSALANTGAAVRACSLPRDAAEPRGSAARRSAAGQGEAAACSAIGVGSLCACRVCW